MLSIWIWIRDHATENRMQLHRTAKRVCLLGVCAEINVSRVPGSGKYRNLFILKAGFATSMHSGLEWIKYIIQYLLQIEYYRNNQEVFATRGSKQKNWGNNFFSSKMLFLYENIAKLRKKQFFHSFIHIN